MFSRISILTSPENRAPAPHPPGERLTTILLTGNYPWFLLTLALIAAALRLRNLGEGLWYDEALYSTKYWMASWIDLLRLSFFDPPAPLYRVFMFFWTTLFGEHELVLRIPSLLFGISSIPLTCLIAETYGSWKVALLAGLLLCLSPVHIWYSQEATPYSMALFFLLAAVYIHQRIMAARPGRAWSFLYLGFLLLSVFTHYYAAIFLLPLSISALTAESRVRRRVITAHFLVASCLVIFLGIKLSVGHLSSGMGFLRPFTWFEWWMLFFNWFLDGNSLWTVNPYTASKLGFRYVMDRPFLVAFQLVFLLLLGRGLLPGSWPRGWTRSRDLFLLLFATPLLLLVLNLLGLRQLYIERYLYLVLPFFFIVIARGASGFSRASLGAATTLLVVLTGLVSCGAFFYKNDIWTVYKPNPDWRSAAVHLARTRQASDELVIFHVTPVDALTYYLRKQGLDSFKAIEIKPADPFPPVLPAINLKRFYLVKNRYWRGEFDRSFLRIKGDQRMRLLSSLAFRGLDLYVFTCRTE